FERTPSVASMAVPVKGSGVPWKTLVPSAGATIVTTGGVGLTVKVTLAVPVAPSESVTAAVSTWTPSWRRTTVRAPPAPRSPSRLDDQRMLALGSGSKSSVAVAARMTGVPAGADAPSAGAVMVTAGAAFGPHAYGDPGLAGMAVGVGRRGGDGVRTDPERRREACAGAE